MKLPFVLGVEGVDRGSGEGQLGRRSARWSRCREHSSSVSKADMVPVRWTLVDDELRNNLDRSSFRLTTCHKCE